ncbi:MAG: antiterminator LoaP [Alkalispirochaeta sp.]
MAVTQMASNFFVLQVMTGEEQRFIALANKAITRASEDRRYEDNGEAEYRFWWPRRKLRIRRRGRTFPTLTPLFPGYVFLETETMTDLLFRAIRRTTGFIRFLKSNDDIRPLSDEDMGLIRHFLSFGEIVTESKVTFDENNRIVVKEGPLLGLEGKIVKVDRRKGRAKVKLDMYENAFLIDLAFEMLEPGKEPEREESA